MDLSVEVGKVGLCSPVLLASGTAGRSDEMAAFMDLSRLGAVVTKSLAVFEWAGNPAPRLWPSPVGMLNSVGLAGPGIGHWLEVDLPRLEAAGAKVVASIWGRTPDEFGQAAQMLRDASSVIVAVEANLSCPNLERGSRPFCAFSGMAKQAIEAASEAGRPIWAKLVALANLEELVEAVLGGGAEAVVVTNSLPAMAIDIETRRPMLGGPGGGLSGPAIHAVAVRAIFDLRRMDPTLALVGVGGVFSGRDALEFLMAGASAVEVGSASFSDPRAAARVAEEIEVWCQLRGVRQVREVVGAVHG